MMSFKLEELSPSGLMKDSRFPKDFVIEVISNIRYFSYC